MYIVFTYYILYVAGSSLTAGQTATHASETSLRANLSSGYDQATRPYTPTFIDVTYYLRSVQALVSIDPLWQCSKYSQILF